MTYEIRIPLTLLGLSSAQLREGIPMNLQVNDNDGSAHETFGAISPGIGHAFRPDRFPLVRFE